MPLLQKIARWHAQYTTPSPHLPWWVPAWRALSWPLWGAVALGYAILTWMFVPFGAGALTTADRVGNPDLAQNIWNVWHFYAVGPTLTTPYVYAPLHVNLVTQSYSWMNLVWTWPLTWLFGPVIAAHSIVWSGFWLGALLASILIYQMVARLDIAVVLGWVLVMTPAHLKNVAWAADENAGIHWLILWHGVLVWWLRRPSWNRSLGVVAGLTALSLVSGYFGLFGAVYAVVFLAMTVASVPERGWRWWVTAMSGTMFATWALLMRWLTSDVLLPDTVSWVIAAPTSFALRDWVMRQTVWLHVVSLLDLVAPMAWHPWWGRIAAIVQRPYPSEMGGYLGMVVVSVTAWASWCIPRIRGLLVVAGVCVVMAMGLEIKVWYDQPFPALPGLFTLFDVVEVFRNASRPGLFLLFAWIPLILVVAVACAHIERRWVALVVLVAMVGDFWPPAWVFAPQHASALARAIPVDAPPGAVVTLPFQKNDARPLIDGMCHGRPVVNGYLARVPAFPVDPQLLTSAPITATRVLPLDTLLLMSNLGIRYVITPHGTATDDALVQAGARIMARHDNDTLWQIPAPTKPAMLVRSGWWDAESYAGRDWRWSHAHAEVALFAATAQVVTIAAHMSSMAPSELHLALDGVPVGQLAVTAQPASTARLITLAIPAGQSVLTFDAPSIMDAYQRAVALSFTQLEIIDATPRQDIIAPALPTTMTYRVCE